VRSDSSQLNEESKPERLQRLPASQNRILQEKKPAVEDMHLNFTLCSMHVDASRLRKQSSISWWRTIVLEWETLVGGQARNSSLSDFVGARND